MQIKIFKDLKQYTLTAPYTKADIELVKKYRPDALKMKDAEGNDVFAVSYVEGKPCVFANGVTFGAATADDGFAMISGEIPANLPAGTTAGEYVADKVGCALEHLTAFETIIPTTVEAITTERKALLDGIEEV